jgi:uncharacterized protein with HEPN domain
MLLEELCLSDMFEAAEAIENFCNKITFEQFEGDDMRRSAILQKLIVIGEAAGRLTPKLTDRYPNVPWKDIMELKNIGVHRYFVMQWGGVWLTAVEEIPVLRKQVDEVLRKEYGD